MPDIQDPHATASTSAHSAKSAGRWGRHGEAPAISADMAEFLAHEVGVAQPWVESASVTHLDQRTGPVSASLVDLIARAREIVGAGHVHLDPQLRLRATTGGSYTDYANLRSGAQVDLPDAVISPADHQQAQQLIEAADATRIVVVPWGGGTSVVGGLRLTGPRIALRTDRMQDMFDLDSQAGLVTVGAGMTGPRLEALLAPRGFTLGHYPQSWEQATIGGYVATRSAGQASTGFGRAEDMVAGLRVATPRGEWSIGRAPASADGPDLTRLMIGSEGRLGVITEVTLRLRRRPTHQRYEAMAFPTMAAGIAAFREMAQTGISADVMRLSDAAETATALRQSAPTGALGQAFATYLRSRGITERHGCLAILGWESTRRTLLGSRRNAAWDVLRGFGAVSLGRNAGESWRRNRFQAPYLRDALLDHGYLVETLETAGTWSQLLPIRDSIHAALVHSLSDATTTPYVMTHISHVYETGASLYTTVLAVADQSSPVSQWARAKQVVTDSIINAGGALTHHHAVGRDHAPWLASQVGEIGLGVLQAVADQLDPRGICNPGVLIPPRAPQVPTT